MTLVQLKRSLKRSFHRILHLAFIHQYFPQILSSVFKRTCPLKASLNLNWTSQKVFIVSKFFWCVGTYFRVCVFTCQPRGTHVGTIRQPWAVAVGNKFTPGVSCAPGARGRRTYRSIWDRLSRSCPTAEIRRIET